MAGHGPVPKRSDQRRRNNKPATPIKKAPSVLPVAPTAPEADPNWHPIALRWYESLSLSGQAQFYEPSDWATAVYVAEVMSRNLGAAKFSAVLFGSVMSAMTDLLTTDGARRRARLELQREAPEAPPSVALMEEYRLAAGSPAGS